ncbi:hypothetical protein [Alkalilimnicola ehrlichii]|uniref:hypothetical protein n=1 Tax=Alkalilimnicola ehrlichii TaxID=351052 RepID=UPI0021626329|nr:hypothetical protein [Alkalilimnicola ehrlichii]
MILILSADTDTQGEAYRQLFQQLEKLPNVSARVHQVSGSQQVLTEIYLIGDTSALSLEQMQALPCVERVVRVSQDYRILGRHRDESRSSEFEYNGVRFGQDNLNLFAGLCAVDTPKHVEMMMRALSEHGLVCTRMGAYKPRTSPYAFQGHGKDCLPYVFELAGKYGIRVIAMEITHESHIREIQAALDDTGHPTGIMLQIGTRNTQNFELLKPSAGSRNSRSCSSAVLASRSKNRSMPPSILPAKAIVAWCSGCAA